MVRKVILVAALAGCVSFGDEATQAALDHAVVCDADADRFCAGENCRPVESGVRLAIPVSLSVPRSEQIGEYCIATGCHEAFFYYLESELPDWRAEVRVGERWMHPVGEVTINRSTWAFTLVKPASDGDTVWSGSCRAAGS